MPPRASQQQRPLPQARERQAVTPPTMPPATSSPTIAPPAATTGQKVIQIAPISEGPNPTEGIDPNTPLETSITPKLEPIVRGTTKPYIVNGETVTPMASLQPFSQSGIASWYGKKFHGKKTASGEPYNMFKLTGAHQTLPIPSYVRVTNVSTQKAVVIRINDRGPFAHNRIIDLSYAAAKQLDILKTGSGRVEITLLDPSQPEMQAATAAPLANHASNQSAAPRSVPPTQLTAKGTFVQLGAFGEERNADHVLAQVVEKKPQQQSLLNKVYNGKVFQVVLGPYLDPSLATQVARELREQLQLPAFIFNRP